MVASLLVIGVHKEELAFGDHIARLIDNSQIEIMRIPSGISNKQTGTDDSFYYETEHREIYLQLRQQTRGRYRLLIDLHCGSNDAGHCADIYCHDRAFLDRLAQMPDIARPEAPVRLIGIVAPTDDRGNVVAGDSR